MDDGNGKELPRAGAELRNPSNVILEMVKIAKKCEIDFEGDNEDLVETVAIVRDWREHVELAVASFYMKTHTETTEPE